MVEYQRIFRAFIDRHALPMMFELEWLTKPAKSYGWKQAQRGATYHIDQSLRTHILNGLYALTCLLEYLQKQGIQSLTEEQYKRSLVYYLLHDIYKDSLLAKSRMDSGTFSVPLGDIESYIERTRIREFIYVSAEEIRMASISLLSNKVGDLAQCPPDTSYLLTFVHLADAFASQQSAHDYHTAERRLQEIVARCRPMITKRDPRLDIPIRSTTHEPLPNIKMIYHELDEYRGLSTLLIHQLVEEELMSFGFVSILYFPNGNLYVGPASTTPSAETIKQNVAEKLLKRIIADASLGEGGDIAQEALDVRKRVKFRTDAYLFCSLQVLLQTLEALPVKKATGFLQTLVEKRIPRDKDNHWNHFYELYAIPTHADAEKEFAERWSFVGRVIMGIEDIAMVLVPNYDIPWLGQLFQVPLSVIEAIQTHKKSLSSGGVADHCYIIAYHWLTQTRFTEQQRQATEVDIVEIQHTLTKIAWDALYPYDQQDQRQNCVNQELGLLTDSHNYINTHLTFSLEQQRLLEDQRLALYTEERSRSHKRCCLICNRIIPTQMKSSFIITSLAEQQAQVFSNRLLPSTEVKGQMQWCPMCYLEFLLRKLGGQGYPAHTDTTISCRLFLYILPDYSFTPQLWNDMGQELLGQFAPQSTSVSRLVLRSKKDEPSVPHYWLEHGTLDPELITFVRHMFADQAEQLAQKSGAHGERLTFSFHTPNYLLCTYDNAVADYHKHKAQVAPTRTEVWAKTIYTALLIHVLTGARIYITERPYLSITRPEEMKTVIELEGLPTLLYSLLPQPVATSSKQQTEEEGIDLGTRISLTALPALLDLCAAVWEITGALFPLDPTKPRNMDKNIASVFSTLQTNPLAGAHFYKDLVERNGVHKPAQAFIRACAILLPGYDPLAQRHRKTLRQNGYEFMFEREGAVLMNLAQQITDASLSIYLPSSRLKGRAHRYERLFRTGVEILKDFTHLEEDELIATVAGHLLKTLDGDRMDRKAGRIVSYGKELRTRVETLATVLVRQLFLERYKGNITKLRHQENALADAIYFLTSQQIDERWAAFLASVKKPDSVTDTQIQEDPSLLADNDDSDQ